MCGYAETRTHSINSAQSSHGTQESEQQVQCAVAAASARWGRHRGRKRLALPCLARALESRAVVLHPSDRLRGKVGKLHAKGLLVVWEDGASADGLVGSANWTRASQTNVELVAAVHMGAEGLRAFASGGAYHLARGAAQPLNSPPSLDILVPVVDLFLKLGPA